MATPATHVRALQIAEGLDLKGLEREDAFSKHPLAFRTANGGLAVLFKTGTVAFVGMTPIEEEEIVRSLSVDPDFARMWSRHDVSGPEDAHIHMDVPGVGVLEIELQNLAVRSMPGYLLTVLSAPARSLTAVIFDQLAAATISLTVFSAPQSAAAQAQLQQQLSKAGSN